MTIQTAKTDILYARDYCLWLETTIEKLRQKQFDVVDWENVIEELESVGRSDRRAVKNLLTRLFEHLLKLGYWKSEREYNANKWKGEIRNFRQQIKDELKASPSLKNYLIEVFPECYRNARDILADTSGLSIDTFPEEPIVTVEQALDESYLTR
ncbi:DUF29 domain-containing protein [Pannus brasiliensis CCIBt3594]|uniref:DUF29 domain-containing protein n=1 Tax=Pannus brasiliensis CCIBt3594 TaxID=1427578 RepID=A0AAW9QNA0_9CHRO